MLIKSRSIKKVSAIAVVNILSTSNNIIINISDTYKNTICIGSGGLLGIKGSKRSTSYAGQAIGIAVGKKVFILGVRYLYVKVKGFGHGRYSSLKGLSLSGLKILSVLDSTPIPFNGCKPSKRRRM
jgi:small subunit ribosomal protein S11|uniref:ribosomal protein S11 n=1 Tax=Cryptomonas pyrenoidifera TaxID=233184 RepID=UPI00226CC958|nr:ribosomal protein S11 [Cryptomonas pyrenoidifera]UZP15137.1 ribosomal protein S11 [Cryptomonas pyrenoidifera]